MKVADALATVRRLFLDTAPIIYYVERNPQYVAVVDEIFDRIDEGTLTAATSPITLSECLVVPCRLADSAIQQRFVDLIVGGQGVLFMVLEHTIARRGAELRAYRSADQ